MEDTNVPSLALDPRLTFAQVGNILTMADDLRFLERFADGRPVLSEAIANDALNEKPISPIRVLNEVGTFQPQSWRSGAIASAVLDFGDPTEIYPFAVMYKSLPMFRGAVDSLARKSSARIPWTTVPETDRRILANAILAVERVFADRYSHSSPSAGAAHIMNLDPASLEIAVSRVNTSVGLEYDFRVLRDGEPAWGAYLRKVSLAEK
ncbi:hypothetical protein EON81_16225 [bacterium]|nr:MAG: hypothetical protein EON81_16225 [bacterium]